MQADELTRLYSVKLQSPVATSFRCVKAANSMDIDQTKKSIHELHVHADITSPFNVGLIVGSSGSGKTTLAKQIYGNDAFVSMLRDETPVIDQFPESMSYDDCANLLAGVGLTSVPCWIRPAYTLSNGQKARADIALILARHATGTPVIDEWTSVVDRTVGAVMSHCVQKFVRKHQRQIVLLSCHYDVIEWLNPDWIIDCNRQEFIDRRLLCRDFTRTTKLRFDIKRSDAKAWKFFSKYHYLSDKLPGGLCRYYGLWHGNEQIGFQAFANYVPHRSGKIQMHSNRTVLHPDFAGLGLGLKLISATSVLMAQAGFDVRAKFSSTPIYKAMSKKQEWQLLSVQRTTPNPGDNMQRSTGFRKHVKTYSFKFMPHLYDESRDGVMFDLA